MLAVLVEVEFRQGKHALALALMLAAVGCTSDSRLSSDGGGSSSDMDAKVADAATADASMRDSSMGDSSHDASTDAGREPSKDAGVFDAATDAQSSPHIDAGDAASHAVDASGRAPDAAADHDDASTELVDAGSVPEDPTHVCGSPALGRVSDTGTSTLLSTLGLQSEVTDIWKDGDFVAGSETSGGWILWNGDTGLQLAASTIGRVVGLAGGVLAVSDATSSTAGHLTMFSVSDGHVLGSVAIGQVDSVGLAADGSYVWSASSAALSSWSTAGTRMSSVSGDYSRASIFAAEGQLRVALGPAGTNVIETVTASDGSTATSPMFSGTFAAWFVDGAKFISSVGANVFIYTSAAIRVQLVPVTAVGTLGGGGSYFWNYRPQASGEPIDLYEVGGDGHVVKSYEAGVIAKVIGSAHRLGFFQIGPGQITIVDLDSKPIADQVVTLPYAYVTAFAADQSGNWAIGTQYGAVHQHGTASSPARSGPLGCGQILALAGASGIAALATAGGGILVVELNADVAGIDLVAGRQPHLTPQPQNSGIALSGDGQILAAAASYISQYEGDRNLYIYEGASWSNTKTYSYTSDGPTVLVGFEMSRSGTTLARTVTSSGTSTYQTTVTSLDGATVIWSDTDEHAIPLLSPDGSHFAVSDSQQAPGSATRLYHSGMLVNAVPGNAVGWLDDNHLVIQTFAFDPHVGMYFDAMRIYSGDGMLLSSPPLPRIDAFDIVDDSSILSHTDGKLYDVTTGAAAPGAAFPLQSVVAGPYIVSVSGRSLRASRH